MTPSIKAEITKGMIEIKNKKIEILAKFLIMLIMILIIFMIVVISCKIILWCGTGGVLGFWKHWWNVPL